MEHVSISHRKTAVEKNQIGRASAPLIAMTDTALVNPHIIGLVMCAPKGGECNGRTEFGT